MDVHRTSYGCNVWNYKKICIPEHNCVLSLAISFAIIPVTLGLNQLIGLNDFDLIFYSNSYPVNTIQLLVW